MQQIYPEKTTTLLYDIKPGDSLSKIIKQYWGVVAPQKREALVAQIMQENPEIQHPDRIYPGQVLVINIPAHSPTVPEIMRSPVIKVDTQTLQAMKQGLQNTTRQEKDMVTTLAPYFLGAGSVSTGTLDYTFKSNARLLSEMAENYNAYKAGSKTKGQYDYARRKLIGKLKTKLGPTRLVLGQNKPLNEILRIRPKKGTTPDYVLQRQAKQMLKLSKLASRGGAVLSVVGLGVACHDIAHADTPQQKNEIFVESLGSFFGGTAYGLAATAAIFFTATPVGWVAALVIAAVGVAVSHLTGKWARKKYITGDRSDIVGQYGIAEMCSL